MEDETYRDSAAARHETHLDRLLNKYVAVWLWSILFGTTTGVLYSFLSFRYDRWGGLGLILIVPASASLLLILLSWLRLYHALTRYLLPRFIASSAGNEPDAHFFAYQIQRTFLYFVYAAAFRALASILELALASSRLMS